MVDADRKTRPDMPQLGSFVAPASERDDRVAQG
jgi:hypothetical protein